MTIARTVVIACLLALGSGCAMQPSQKPLLKPWVKPYERGLLADPIMSFSRDPLASKHRQHVFEVREGARGAGQAQGGGCGCN